MPTTPTLDEIGPGKHLPVIKIAVLWAASRLALLITGILSTYLLASGLTIQTGNLVYHEPTIRALDIWARWDSEWYLLIAGEGYDSSRFFQRFGVPYEPGAAAGFLPLYPMLIRLVAPLLGGVGAGVLISNLALLGSLLILYRLAADDAPDGAEESTGLGACAALLVYPSSLFLSAVYAESLFLMLSLITFLQSRRGRFAMAGFAGGLASLTRPFGVLLLLPALWEWWRLQRSGQASRSSSLWLLQIPFAFALFMLYCQSLFGDALMLFHRQTRWRGGLSGPWQAFIRWWEAGPIAHGAHGSTFELVVAILVIALLPLVALRLRGSYTVYAIAAVLVALGSTLWSFSRLVVTLFPLFILAGQQLGTGRKLPVVLYGFVAATLSGLFMALFANWWWVG